jgi:biopolymer transport protein ExbD
MRTPLGILEKVRSADQSLDAIPFILFIVCGALVSILTAHFVYAPGMYIGFNTVPAAHTKNINAPKSTSGDMAQTATTVTLLSARGTGVFVVSGRVVDNAGLKTELHRVAQMNGARLRPVLIKADAALTLQNFITVCDLVRTEGFPGVLIATEER